MGLAGDQMSWVAFERFQGPAVDLQASCRMNGETSWFASPGMKLTPAPRPFARISTTESTNH